MAQPLPNWLPTADLQVGQAGPVISGVPPPPKYQGLSVEQQAYKDAQYFTQMAAGIGRGNPGMAAQLRMYTQDALSRSKPTQERFDWNLENFDRLKMGEKDIPFSQWKADESGRGVTYAAAMERYKEASSASEKAQNLEGPTQVLKNVMSNPAYFSGSDVSTEGLAQGLSLVKNSKNALVSLGVPIPDWLSSRVDNATTGIQLREVAQSLNNAATLSRLGSLSKGVSEGDRRFAERIGTSNLNSVPGNQLILEYTQAMIDQQKGLGVIVDDLRSAKGGKLAPEDINRAVRSYNDDHPIAFDKSGKPINELGVRLQNLVNQQKESPGLSSDIKSGLQTVTDTASAAGRSIKTAVESAAAVPGNVAQTVAAIPGNIAQANAGPAPAAEAYPQSVEPTFQPGLRRDPTAVGNKLVDLAYAKGGPNVGSMINLRQSVRPDQAPAMQAAITQKLGTGNSGEFDLTNWSTAYSSLGTKEKAGLYGGATPGSLRSNLEDIAKNTDAVNGLWRNVPGPQLAQALSNPAGASSIASWTRAYSIMQRAGMTPQAIARFKLATDNLNNNIGSNLVWNNFVQRGGR
jgi:hypothetical protein